MQFPYPHMDYRPRLGPFLLGPNDESENGVYGGDARELARLIPDKSVALWVTDPPYGIGYASCRKTRRDGSPRLNMPDFGKGIYDSSWLVEVERTLKPGGAFYMFTRWDVLQQWKEDIEATGLKVAQRLVWDKTHWGMGDLRYYGSQTEEIIFAVKGDHRLRWDKRCGNVVRRSAAFLPEGQFDHPTQKPESIIETFVLNSSDPGDVVVDLFVGSGTTAVVCKKHGRRYIAADIRKDYCQMTRERVNKTNPPLFVLQPEQTRLPDPEIAQFPPHLWRRISPLPGWRL